MSHVEEAEVVFWGGSYQSLARADGDGGEDESTPTMEIDAKYGGLAATEGTRKVELEGRVMGG
jgi:hypothetical protein